jgi:hypothetical protein
MNKVLLDPILKTKLNGLNEHLELCDDSGQTVGHFLPADLYKQMLFAWADAQIDEEELAKRRKEPRGRALKDIWQNLGQS